jgi:exodeoxyribonuclease (lambda-induced)
VGILKIHAEIAQGHIDWFKLRMGIPTASELGNLLTPEFELRKGEMPKSFVYTKVAESFTGKPIITTGSWNTEQGEILEGEARPWYELEYEKRVRQVGFITTDDGRFGCSPDGLIEGEECGLEIKCPASHTHVKYLVNGSLPKEYAAQVMGSMFATGFDRWIFLSYHRGFPALVLEIHRDERAMSMIRAAINQFHGDFDRAIERIGNITNITRLREMETA